VSDRFIGCLGEALLAHDPLSHSRSEPPCDRHGRQRIGETRRGSDAVRSAQSAQCAIRHRAMVRCARRAVHHWNRISSGQSRFHSRPAVPDDVRRMVARRPSRDATPDDAVSWWTDSPATLHARGPGRLLVSCDTSGRWARGT